MVRSYLNEICDKLESQNLEEICDKLESKIVSLRKELEKSIG